MVYLGLGGTGRVSRGSPGRRSLSVGDTFGETFQTLSSDTVFYISVVMFLYSLYFLLPLYCGGFLVSLRGH